MSQRDVAALGFAVWCSLLFAISGYAQVLRHEPCVVEDIGTPTLPACVVEISHGGFHIRKKYWKHPSFNQYGLSAFTVNGFGRVYIDRSGRILVRDVAFSDNGPDAFAHGLVRIEHNGKYGYADPAGKIVVPVQYSCAINFKDQFTDVGPNVCSGCRIEQQGEYHACVGGQWFQVDQKGHLSSVPAPK